MESDKDFHPKAYENARFLHSAHARSLRILAEYLEPQSRLRLQKIRSTIVFFGSARSVPEEELDMQLAKLNESWAKERNITPEKIHKRTESFRRLTHYYHEAERLAAKLAAHYQQMPDPRDRHVICSGAGPGMMEAANRGAQKIGAKTVGLSISLPHEQGVNRYLEPPYTFEFHYFFMRKYWFVYLSRALVAFPGGFGTFDELFECLTLVQTQKIRRNLPIVLFGTEFWNNVINFEALIEWGVISPDDLDLFLLTDDIDEAYDYLVNRIDVSRAIETTEEP
ncbi:LOG family protein [bacterium]|nr:LOG family protein [bacterium]